MRTTLLQLAALLILSATALAQPGTMDRSTPEAVAQRYFEAMKGDRHDEIIALTHPAVLDTFSARMMPVLERAAGSKTKAQKELFAFLGGGKKIQALRAMRPAQLAQAILSAIMKEEGAEAFYGSLAGTPLGHVMEGSDLAHVVYRLELGGDAGALVTLGLSDAAVITMRRGDDGWYLASPRELQVILFAFTIGHGAELAPPAASHALESGVGSTTKASEHGDWMQDDYGAALAKARASGKAMFVAFTGYNCGNCRLMERNMFTREDVADLMRQFVLVRLYTDNGDSVNTFNQDMQLKRFNTIVLPYYAIINPEDSTLAEFVGTTTKPDAFKAFLKQGLGAMMPSDGDK